ncbi:hypothetical protein [Aeromicrobium sp. UC242_57]|uniref:hypothetical protein n=1 Tax=Aeromicrobium sp. UC242_57 TaxID=3374624 RepID=UPI0037B5ACFA
MGGVWRLKATMSKRGRTAAGTRSTFLDAFHWTFLYEFYDKSGRLNRPAGTSGVQHKVGRAAIRGPSTTASSSSRPSWSPGGSTAVVDIRGYKCKKITFRIGVEDRSEASEGRYKISQPSSRGNV